MLSTAIVADESLVEAFLRYLTIERDASEHTCIAYLRDIAQFGDYLWPDKGKDDFT